MRQKLDPPERLDDEAREVWGNIVKRGRLSRMVDEVMLETYVTLITRWREASRRVAEEGLIVPGGERKGAIVHPAIAIERSLADQIREWAPMFNQPAPPRRKSGHMYDATKRSIAAAPGLEDDKQFDAISEVVLTLAWLIDEAQRDGAEAIQKATYNLIPTYVKGCAELQITPASIPLEARKKAGTSGKVDKFQRSAAERRRLQAV